MRIFHRALFRIQPIGHIRKRRRRMREAKGRKAGQTVPPPFDKVLHSEIEKNNREDRTE